MKHRRIQLLVITTAAAAWAVLTAVEPSGSGSPATRTSTVTGARTTTRPRTRRSRSSAWTAAMPRRSTRIARGCNGLSWMVTTDHGGPNHSKLNLTRAYAELKASREMVPEVLQFYGMELNMPAMDHHTLIIPHSEHEASMLSRHRKPVRLAGSVAERSLAKHGSAGAASARTHQEPAAAPAAVRQPSLAIGDRRGRLWVGRAARVASQ